MNLNKTEIKELNKKHGGYYFSKDTMRFFNSKLETVGKISGQVAYFITSEQFDENSPRKYTIRQINLQDGSISSYSEFQEYKTIADAKEVMKNIV